MRSPGRRRPDASGRCARRLGAHHGALSGSVPRLTAARSAGAPFTLILWTSHHALGDHPARDRAIFAGARAALLKTNSLCKELDTAIALPFDEPGSITRLVALPDDTLSGACVAKTAADSHETRLALSSERELSVRNVRSLLHRRDAKASTSPSRPHRSSRSGGPSWAGLTLLFLFRADVMLAMSGGIQADDSSGVARDTEQHRCGVAA